MEFLLFICKLGITVSKHAMAKAAATELWLKAYPQLKCVAIQAITFFIFNIIYTIVSCILFTIFENNQIIIYSSIAYILLFMIITASTIIIINLKK